MNEYDWNHIATLLHVAEKVAGHPKLKNIATAVNAELEAIANPQEPEVEQEGKAEKPSRVPLPNEVPTNGRRA